MKKYLLLFLMCVYASIGAWAGEEITVTTESGVSVITITDNSSSDVTLASGSTIPGIPTNVKIVGNLSGEVSTFITNNGLHNINNFTRLDLSEATGFTTAQLSSLSLQGKMANIKHLILPTGASVPSEEQIKNNTAGSLDIYDAMEYFVIPQNDGTCDIYLTEVGLTSISDADIIIYNKSASTVTVHLAEGEDENPATEATKTTIENYLKTQGYKLFVAPYTVSGCNVSINMDGAAAGQTLADLIATAKAEVTGSICTLTVTGQLTANDLIALGGTNMTGATRIDLSGATLATGASINNITLPASLEQLVLPKGMGTTKLPDALRSKFAGASNLMYAYSPTSDTQTATAQHVADLVWVNQAGGLDKAIINEAKLRTAIYVKVESAVALNNDDVDLATNNKQTGENTYENVSLDNTSTDATNYAWQYIDMSGANLQNDVIVSYKAPQKTNSYRLILPDGWGPNRMSIIPSVKEQNYGSGLAAVYSYTALGFLQILEINDTQYKPGALTDNRIVRDGTKAVRVVSGEYNGTPYGVFGQLQADATKNNLFAAINGAAPSIEAVTITDVRTATNEPLTFTNKNLIYIQLDRVKSMYNQELKTDGPIINVDGCTKLQTLNLLNSVLASVDASVNTLTSVDMSGTTVVGTTDLSTSPITNIGFVTNSDTWFKDDLDLSKTALTTFTTTAKVGTTTANTGDIILNENELTNVSLNQVQFQNTTSVIHVRKAATDDPSTTEVDETKVLTGTLGDNSIIVPTGFASSTRIDPYIQTAIKEQEYVAPAYVFSATDMYLHEKETTGGSPDKFVYWYTGTLQDNKVLTITMTDERRGTLATLLGSGNANITSSTNLVRFKIVGPLASNDLAALASVNAQILDLSEATFYKYTAGDPATYTVDNSIIETGSTINQYAKFLLLPANMTRDDVYENSVKVSDGIVNATSLAGFTGLYSAISLTDYNPNNAFDFTSYNKVAGTLQPAVIAAGRGTLNGSQMIRGEEGSKRTAYYPTMSGNYNRSATISGLVNAYDLSYGVKLDTDGHLAFNKIYANESLDADDRTNVGTETNVQGAFSGSNGPKTLDLKAAEITGPEYINDICISYLVPTNMLKYLIIPETSSVKETPSYFIQHNTIKEICIPSNIEIIRTHFAPSVDHIWTNGYNVGQTGGDIANMTYDNGAVSAANADPAYGYTDYTFTGLYPHGTYTFSSNLKLIESRAFSNTTPHVSDVYVLAKKAPECHVDAFCTAMYIGNSGFAPNIVGGVITRDSYVNGSNWITMLHYPRECVSPEVQRYTDPTRQYSIASNEVDGKGGVLYYPSYGEFLAAYAQGTTGYLWNAWDRTYEFGMLKASLSIGNTGWTLKNQQDANAKFLANPDLTTFPDDTKYTCTSFYDVTAGGKESQPSGLVQYYDVRWNEKVLSDKGAGIQLYPQANTANADLNNTVTARDYRGWHQFVLNAFAANTDVPMQPSRSYITDTDWWTVCLPYDLTYNEVMLFYGDVNSTGQVNDATKVPYLALLSNVVRDEKNKYITLNFSSNVMEHTATYDGVNGVWNIDANTAPTGTDVVLHKGVPYMIKPTFKANAGRQFDVYGPGQAISSELSGDRIIALEEDYPGLYEKLKLAEDIAGQEFREMMENNLYTVPAFLPKDDWDGNYHSEDRVDATEYEYNNKQYYRSSEYDYTFVGAFMKNIIPPYAYFLGYKGKALYVYADYLSAAYKAITGKKPDYENEFRWTNNSCEIMPNMLSTTEGTKANSKANKYNLGHTGGHNGKVTEASGTGENMRPARWEIFGTSAGHLTAVCADDHTYNNNGGVTSAKGMDMLFDADFVIVTPGEVTNIEVVKTAEGEITGKVFTIDGRYVGESLTNLPKGVYVRNGKKVVVK